MLIGRIHTLAYESSCKYEPVRESSQRDMDKSNVDVYNRVQLIRTVPIISQLKLLHSDVFDSDQS